MLFYEKKQIVLNNVCMRNYIMPFKANLLLFFGNPIALEIVSSRVGKLYTNPHMLCKKTLHLKLYPIS